MELAIILLGVACLLLLAGILFLSFKQPGAEEMTSNYRDIIRESQQQLKALVENQGLLNKELISLRQYVQILEAENAGLTNLLQERESHIKRLNLKLDEFEANKGLQDKQIKDLLSKLNSIK